MPEGDLERIGESFIACLLLCRHHMFLMCITKPELQSRVLKIGEVRSEYGGGELDTEAGTAHHSNPFRLRSQLAPSS